MGATGSSDAHEIDVVGCYFTDFRPGSSRFRNSWRPFGTARDGPGTGPGFTSPAGRLIEAPGSNARAGNEVAMPSRGKPAILGRPGDRGLMPSFRARTSR